MRKYITLGNWNKNYLFIIGTTIFLTTYNVINGYSYYSYNFSLIGDIKEINQISEHVFIHQFIFYFIIFISSFFFDIYEKKKYKKEKREKDKKVKKKGADSNEILIIIIIFMNMDMIIKKFQIHFH